MFGFLVHGAGAILATWLAPSAADWPPPPIGPRGAQVTSRLFGQGGLALTSTGHDRDAGIKPQPFHRREPDERERT